MKKLIKTLISPDLDDLEYAARMLDVELCLGDRGSYVALIWIKRLSDIRGSGRDAMTLLLRWADQNKRSIRLHVLDDNVKLIAFYEGMDFQIVGRDDDGDIEMVRHPRT